jgi:hypothetical protein
MLELLLVWASRWVRRRTKREGEGPRPGYDIISSPAFPQMAWMLPAVLLAPLAQPAVAHAAAPQVQVSQPRGNGPPLPSMHA